MRLIKKRRMWGGSRGGDIAIFILLALVGIFMLFPIYFSFIQSIKPVEELFLFPPKLYVQRPTMQSFEDMLKVAGRSVRAGSRRICFQASVKGKIQGFPVR